MLCKSQVLIEDMIVSMVPLSAVLVLISNVHHHKVWSLIIAIFEDSELNVSNKVHWSNYLSRMPRWPTF